MDEFFRDVNLDIFRKWVYLQIINHDDFIFEEEHYTYKIYYKNKVAYFVMWPQGIIEETIKRGNETIFYLHYQFYNFYFAKDLFCRMINKLVEDKEKNEINVLLCCTSGFTTSFFADKMNNYCQLNQKPYHLQATAIYHLDDIYQKYQLILIAPQLRYKIAELTQKYKPVVIQSIESIVFATYDCQALLEQIEIFYQGE